MTHLLPNDIGETRDNTPPAHRLSLYAEKRKRKRKEATTATVAVVARVAVVVVAMTVVAAAVAAVTAMPIEKKVIALIA